MRRHLWSERGSLDRETLRKLMVFLNNDDGVLSSAVCITNVNNDDIGFAFEMLYPRACGHVRSMSGASFLVEGGQETEVAIAGKLPSIRIDTGEKCKTASKYLLI
jgi:hypothetical protein